MLIPLLLSHSLLLPSLFPNLQLSKLLLLPFPFLTLLFLFLSISLPLLLPNLLCFKDFNLGELLLRLLLLLLLLLHPLLLQLLLHHLLPMSMLPLYNLLPSLPPALLLLPSWSRSKPLHPLPPHPRSQLVLPQSR